MVQCISALLDFTYIARRDAHDSHSLLCMEEALERFHNLRTIFEEVGLRLDNFSLPRQHALIHYVRSIKLFGSPNGLCSSITESKHIRAVKRPWRSTNKHNALPQILLKNERLLKMSMARSDFGRRGMLVGDVLSYVTFGPDLPVIFEDEEEEARAQAEADVEDVDGDRRDTIISLSSRPGKFFFSYLILT